MLGARPSAVELEVPESGACLDVVGARQADARIPLVAVGGKVSDFLNARASRLVHAQVGEEAMEVRDLALAAEKPRDTAPMILEKHRSFHRLHDW
jgi:hypothetical protein